MRSLNDTQGLCKFWKMAALSLLVATASATVSYGQSADSGAQAGAGASSGDGGSSAAAEIFISDMD